jgi:hypothetical protein
VSARDAAKHPRAASRNGREQHQQHAPMIAKRT